MPESSLVVNLSGHLTAEQLQLSLQQIEPHLRAGERTGLVVDCREMTGYDVDARAVFVDWNTTWRERISRVSIVTDKVLWHMVVGAMALASRQLIKPFASLDEAVQWAETP